VIRQRATVRIPIAMIVALVCALVSATACARAPSLATLAHGLPPFDALSAEHLGMRAHAFAAARPAARVLEYTGYRDSIGSFATIFRFSQPPIVRNAIPAGSLEAIAATRDFASDSFALRAWDSLYANAVRGFDRSPDGCWNVQGESGGNALIAIWNERRDQFIAGHWSAALGAASNGRAHLPGVTLILQTREQADHLANIQPRRRVSCPR